MKKGILLILSLICLPISFYLSYKTYTMIGATELMWFLYWINMPVIIIVQIISKLIED